MMEINYRTYYTWSAEESPEKSQISTDCENDPFVKAPAAESQGVAQVDVSTVCTQSKIPAFSQAMR